MLIKFFLKKYKIEEQHFGKPSIFAEFHEFLREDGEVFPFNMAFKNLFQDYQIRQLDNSFNVYTIELLSYFDIKILKKKSKYIDPLTKEMHRQPIGYFSKLFNSQDKERDSYMNLVKGFQTLISLNPLIGIEFFDNSQIIPNQSSFLTNLNLKDDSNFNYLKQAIKFSFSDLGFSRQNL